MAGNTRGKLKEQFEGIHRNFDWSQTHCERALELIRQHNPKLTGMVKALHKGIKTLDELSQQVYARL